jgi:hypothetical protein
MSSKLSSKDLDILHGAIWKLGSRVRYTIQTVGDARLIKQVWRKGKVYALGLGFLNPYPFLKT